ncbi:DUF6233 domain-containing protein [Streptomyces diastaticus]|uniref:DUF6233 domain-containing protein n=1 Tax=Streptomyces diastaticus TaxID=1956 RepID=UPI003651C27A
MDDSASVSRLEMLYFARRVAEQHLAQVQRWITAEQQRLDEQAEGDRRRPPPPEWAVERGIGTGPPPAVHVGTCDLLEAPRWVAIDRSQALAALEQGVEPCMICRPDTELGWPG